MDGVVILLPIISGIICGLKYKLAPITFYVMFIVSVCGWGFYYNDQMRFGPIFPSDLFLLLFLVWFILHNKGLLEIDRNTFTILCLVVFIQFMLSFISFYDLGEALADFKLLLYFFVPYLYGKSIKYKKEENTICLIAYCFCIGISLILNWINFFSAGLINIAAGGNQIIRTFGIGLGFSCGATMACILMDYKTEFIRKYSGVVYYAIHIILILSSLASFTRTSWIIYILVVVLNYIFVILKLTVRPDLNLLLHKILNFLVVIVISISVFTFIKNEFPEITNAIVERIETITEGEDDPNENTLNRRFEDVASGIEVFFSPRVIIGYGFGALYRNSYGDYVAQAENSYVFYLWKFGLIFGIYLFIRVVLFLRKKLVSSCLASKTYGICCGVGLLIGSMSGNLNRPYTLGATAILMAINWSLVFGEGDENE